VIVDDAGRTLYELPFADKAASVGELPSKYPDSSRRGHSKPVRLIFPDEASLATKRGKSVDFIGYWQRRIAVEEKWPSGARRINVS
jgi:hypothetical protein